MTQAGEQTSELSERDADGLRTAIRLAQEARDEGNEPFGAVVLDAAGALVAQGKNAARVPATHPTAHAEMLAAHEASRGRSPEELEGCTLYTSCEPCAMCAGTVYWAGIRRVVFGITERQLREVADPEHGHAALDFPCTDLFARSGVEVAVVGPALVDEAMAVHDGFWS